MLDFSWLDWTVIGASATTLIALLTKIISAVKIGSNAVRTFAVSKVNNAQAELNNKVDNVQLKVEEKINKTDAKVLELEQKIVEYQQAIAEYQNLIRSMLDNA